jgi:hypothetical protein
MFRTVLLPVFVVALALPATHCALAGGANLDRTPNYSKNSNTAACRKIVERYKALLKADPEAPFRKRDYAASPLDVLPT